MIARWSFPTNLFSRFQRAFWILKIPHVTLSTKFYFQLIINSGYPSLQSHNEGLQLLPYNIDLLKTKILFDMSRITPLSRITPFTVSYYQKENWVWNGIIKIEWRKWKWAKKETKVSWKFNLLTWIFYYYFFLPLFQFSSLEMLGLD
jgi:hypothetical protein